MVEAAYESAHWVERRSVGRRLCQSSRYGGGSNLPVKSWVRALSSGDEVRSNFSFLIVVAADWMERRLPLYTLMELNKHCPEVLKKCEVGRSPRS